MITERAIINALIITAGFILVPFIVSSTLTSDYAPLLFFGGLTALVLAFFFFKEKLCVMPLLGAAVAGSMNFLPLPLNTTDIAVLMLICYYVTGYVVIRQKRIKVGKPMFFWPIVTIVAILLIHNHNLNLKSAGADTEGGKPAYLIYLIVLGYFCGINTTRPSVNFLSKIPLWFFLLSAISSIPYLLSTYFPGLAPYFYTVTSSVNVDVYVDSLGGVGNDSESQGAIGRLAVFGPVGATLQIYLLSHYPIGTWIRPERWWVAGLSLVCAGLAITSGYRSVLFDFAMMTMVGAWCYYSWRSFFLPVGICIMAFILIILSSNGLIHLPVNKLPMIAQRSLSFLPGDWDQEAIISGEGSNNFRKSIQDVYIKEYMMQSPLIGHGFIINTKDFDAYTDALRVGGSAETNEYLQAKVFIEGKLFHTGWISVYDIVGIIGSIAFVALGAGEVLLVYHFLFGPRADRRSTLYPLYVWLMCNILTMMVGFFTVFGDFGSTFMDLCCYAIVLSHLYDLENTREIPVPLDERKASYQPGEAKAALYGYQSR
jgi:hypothetical protein